MRLLLCLYLLLCLLPAALPAQVPATSDDYRADFDFLWETVRDDYAYFDLKQTDWNQVRATYRPQLDTLRSRRAFVRLLEQVLGELYDYHAGLNTNRLDSRRLVPTASDVYAEWVGNRARVLAVRPGYGAERVGVRPGQELTAVQGEPVAAALQPWLPRCLRQPDPAARNFALNELLAGDHRTPRQWEVAGLNGPRTVQPDVPVSQLEDIRYAGRLASIRYGKVGYIKLNNILGDNKLIARFDSVLTALADTQGLILDLRETPSGGNTTVARAIMGRFISQEGAYQRHELPSEERQTGIRRRWVELVSPRGPAYTRPLVVLAGRWTGSMGEGLAIGFDGLRRATVVGTALARLHGAIYSYRLPHSGINFVIPAERLYHVNGQPREQYLPPVLLDPAAPLPAGPTADAGINRALALLAGQGPKR